MTDKLEELKLAYEKADAEFREAYKTYLAKIKEKDLAQERYERELFKTENCGTCKYGVISDIDPIDGNHNVCGCEDAPCTCCNRWCENYQPDTPLTKAIKEDLDCYIDRDAYCGLKKFYGDILAVKGSINPQDEDYNPIAKMLYDILKVRYGVKRKWAGM